MEFFHITNNFVLQLSRFTCLGKAFFSLLQMDMYIIFFEFPHSMMLQKLSTLSNVCWQNCVIKICIISIIRLSQMYLHPSLYYLYYIVLFGKSETLQACRPWGGATLFFRSTNFVQKIPDGFKASISFPLSSPVPQKVITHC